jgi:dihydroflavonol-4-reductase
MKVFVTGATGFIGQNLVEALHRRGDEVFCLVRPGSNRTLLQSLGVNLVEGDLLEPGNLGGKISPPEIVYHLAGVTKSIDDSGYFRGNVRTTENLLKLIAPRGRPGAKLVYVSSQAAAGPSLSPDNCEEVPPSPVSRYGASKYAAERLVSNRKNDGNFTILRPSIVYGPHDREMLPLFRAASRSLLPHPGFGPYPVNVIYVADLVEAILLAGRCADANGKTYFVNDGRPTSWGSINRAICRGLEQRAVTLPVPLRVMQLVCLLSGFIARSRGKAAYMNRDKWQEIKQRGWLCSAAKIRRELGFRAHWTLDSGISATAEWYRDSGLL